MSEADFAVKGDDDDGLGPRGLMLADTRSGQLVTYLTEQGATTEENFVKVSLLVVNCWVFRRFFSATQSDLFVLFLRQILLAKMRQDMYSPSPLDEPSSG